ncbi:MAG: glycosyl hydrolase family 8 [Defluviitaleaceae bacterium]|nr:glycosyl hydrolase family 8 [Defluviitaleaceae bacterium]
MKFSRKCKGIFTKAVSAVICFSMVAASLPAMADSAVNSDCIRDTLPGNEGQCVCDIIWGDVDGDGEVTPADASLIRQYLARGASVPIDRNIADVNRDGIVSLHDVLLTRRYIALGSPYYLGPSPGWNEPNPRSVIEDFENSNMGAWPLSTRGDSFPAVSVVPDPENPGQRSLQVSVTGWNQAPIIPIHLPHALENYQTISLRIRREIGTPTGNFQVFASNSSAETGNFVQWGFGNSSAQQHHFSHLHIASSSGLPFNFDNWTTITIPINTNASTANLQGNIFLALGINTNTAATFMIDDITLTLRDGFVLPDPGASVAAPTLESVAARSITVNATSPPANGQTVEYGISTINTPPTTWQSGRTFGGLTESTVYYIFARSAANDDFRAGPPSQALRVTTLEEPPPQPVPRGEGAAFTGIHRNMLAEAGYSQQQIDQRIELVWYRLFESTETAVGTSTPHNHAYRLFYWTNCAIGNCTNIAPCRTGTCGTMGYMLDSGNPDVRSEGMSYGMVMAVQMDRQDIFDALWRWAYTYMLHRGSNFYGYFAWQLNPNGTTIDPGPAPDGEIFFATALLFASARWGDGTGVLEYGWHGRKIIHDLINRQNLTGDSNNPLFCPTHHLPIMSPMGQSKFEFNHSYLLPAFFEIWADEIEYGVRNGLYPGIWSSDTHAMQDAEYWRMVVDLSRNFFTTIHPGTGLAPEYAAWDGTPIPDFKQFTGFHVDASRVAANIAMDYSWWAEDVPNLGQWSSNPDVVAGLPWHSAHANTIQAFFATDDSQENIPRVQMINPRGLFSYGSAFTVDGMFAPEHGGYGSEGYPRHHSPGLIGGNATASLVATNEIAWDFIHHFWNTNMTRGRWRYYDGCLYFFSLLHLSGNYRPFFSTGAIRQDGGLNARINAPTNSFNKAAPFDIPVTVWWNGHSLVSVTNNGVPLIEGTDFILSGDTIDLTASFLSSLPIGRAWLTFNFSGGNSATWRMEIDDTNVPVLGHTFQREAPVRSTSFEGIHGRPVARATFPGNSTMRVTKYGGHSQNGIILPFRLAPGTNLHDHNNLYVRMRHISGMAGNFDFRAEVADANEVMGVFNTNALLGSANNLSFGGSSDFVDFVIPFAAGRPALTGDIQIALGRNAAQHVFEIYYIGIVPFDGFETPDSSITPSVAEFDLANPAGITVSVAWNDNTLTAIQNGAVVLTQGSDFVVSGNQITINSSFLETLARGTTTLTFVFSAGQNRSLAITIMDSYEPPLPPVGIRHTFEQPLDGVRSTPVTGGQGATASFPLGENVMRVTKTGGNSTHGVIIPFYLGNRTLADYSHFRIVTRPGPNPGDLSWKQFHVEVMPGHDATFDGFGNNIANRLVPFQQFNFVNPQDITLPINAEVGGLTGAISIAIGLNWATAHTLDVVEIELVPRNQPTILGASYFVGANAAANTSVRMVVVSDVSGAANRGEYVDVYFYLDENPGINFVGFNVTFDPNVLAPRLLSAGTDHIYAGHTASGSLGGLDFDGGLYHPTLESPGTTVSFSASTDTNATGRLGFIRFAVAEDAALGQTTIQINHGVTSNEAWDILNLAPQSSEITVGGFGDPPPTGVRDMFEIIAAMFAVSAISAVLWTRALRRRKARI